MGFFDDSSQYFDDPDVNNGYSGMDDSGGGYDYYGDLSGTFADDGGFDFSNLATNFFDTSDAWDQSYDALFGDQPEDAFSNLTGDDDESDWWKDTKEFLGSKSGMGLLGGLLGGVGRAIASGKQSDYLSSQKERDRAFQERMQQMKFAHDKEMLAAKLAASGGGGGGGMDRPGPGTADSTTSNLDRNKVRWPK